MKEKQHQRQEALITIIHSRKQLSQLHLVALAITGCPEAAESSLMKAVEDMQDSFLISAEFAFPATKRATIKRCLQHVAGELQDLIQNADKDDIVSLRQQDSRSQLEGREILPQAFLEALLSLNVFHRAVLILRVYERFREYEAALLLRIPLDVLRRGQANALQALASALEEPSPGGVEFLEREAI